MLKFIFLYILTILVSFKSYGANHQCFDFVRTNTCLIEKEYVYDETLTSMENFKKEVSVECLAGSEKYADLLEEVFEKLPAHTQMAFCHIKKIFIVPGETNYGGFGQLSYDTQNVEIVTDANGIAQEAHDPNGFLLYISKKYRFDNDETYTDFLNRNYHLDFGIDTKTEGYSDALPIWTYRGGSEEPSSLYNTILHEVGHFVEFAGEFTRVQWEFNPVVAEYEMSLPEWTRYSWEIVAENGADAKLVPKLPEILKKTSSGFSLTKSDEIAEAFNKSDFVSFYAMTEPSEDFAEHYKAFHSPGETILARDGKVFVRSKDRPSAVFQKKLDYIGAIGDDIFAKVHELQTYYLPVEVK